VLATVDEAWACHEFFRRLDVPAEDIFLEIRYDVVQVMAKQNSHPFYIFVGLLHHDESGSEFIDRWKEFLQRLPDIPEKNLQRTWTESHVSRSSIEILAKLIDQGFKIKKFVLGQTGQPRFIH